LEQVPGSIPDEVCVEGTGVRLQEVDGPEANVQEPAIPPLRYITASTSISDRKLRGHDLACGDSLPPSASGVADLELLQSGREVGHRLGVRDQPIFDPTRERHLGFLK